MFRSTFIVSVLSALAAGISFLNQLVLAKYFGASAEMAAYLIAVSVPVTVAGLVAGVLSYQLVPALQRAESSHRGAEALVRSLTLGLGGGATVIALIGIFAAGRLTFVLVPGVSTAQHLVILRLAHIAWLYVPFSVLGAIFMAGLHIRRRFTIATLLVSAPIVGSLIVCVAAHKRLGIEAVVWGQLAGYVAMLGGLRLTYGGSVGRRDWRGFRGVVREFPRAVAAVLIFVIYPFSDAFWGARIGPAAVSYLGYAQRLLVGFSGLAVVGLTTVLFPRLASHAAEGKADSLRKDLGGSIQIMLVCMVPGATIFSLLATPSLELLLRRGSFRLADVTALGSLLPIMLCGMVAMSCTGLVFKALFACQKATVAAILSLVGSFVYFALSGLLGGSVGVIGIGLAYASSWWLVFGLGLVYLWRDLFGATLVLAKLKFAARLGVATISAALIVWLGRQFLPSEGNPEHLRRLGSVVGLWFVAALVYLVIGRWLLAISEVRLLTEKIAAVLASKRRRTA